jgi:hypothetical protein
LGVAGGIQRVNAATGKDIGTWREAGGHGAACHQHLKAAGRVTQQQYGGSGAGQYRRTLGVQELGRTWHTSILQPKLVCFAVNKHICTGDK